MPRPLMRVAASLPFSWRSVGSAIATTLAASGCAMAQSEAPDCGIYTYRAEIVRVIDGDTVVADIDLGFDVWLRGEHLRLFGIDTPELDTDAGRSVKQVLKDRIEGRTLFICTIKAKQSDREVTGSFGRYLTEIYDGSVNINAWLLDEGMAVPFEK